ncbi:MAG TPA: hypothetical protein VD794_12010 [Flavisolibacter sp.]|nr:hypothetical protein [Flavisolibacter sp.]
MRKHHFVPIVLFCIASLFIGCQKETSETFDNNQPGTSAEHQIAVAFTAGTININHVDSVVIDLIGATPADYKHLTLKKMSDRFVTDSIVPEAGYNAYVIIYLRPEDNNAYAFLSHQLYGGGNESIQKTAPKALTDDFNWKLMGRVFDRANEFFALIGIAPTNPLVYLYTNAQKRNYIYVDKSYMDNGQAVSSDTYEYHVTAPLLHPVAIKNAFSAAASSMEGKAWTTFSSMAMAMNDQTGQENIFYFQHLK